MRLYNKYIVTTPIRKTVLCGEIDLKKGTKCSTIDYEVRNQETNEITHTKIITCDNGSIAFVTSQDAFDYFSQNDDSQGKLRGKLVKSIIKQLARKSDFADSPNDITQKRWNRIWKNSLCQKYKRADIDDHWLWNYEFYNAPISDLQYIAKLVDVK